METWETINWIVAQVFPTYFGCYCLHTLTHHPRQTIRKPRDWKFPHPPSFIPSLFAVFLSPSSYSWWIVANEQTYIPFRTNPIKVRMFVELFVRKYERIRRKIPHFDLTSRADRKSQVRQCLVFCSADSSAKEDQKSAVPKIQTLPNLRLPINSGKNTPFRSELLTIVDLVD